MSVRQCSMRYARNCASVITYRSCLTSALSQPLQRLLALVDSQLGLAAELVPFCRTLASKALSAATRILVRILAERIRADFRLTKIPLITAMQVHPPHPIRRRKAAVAMPRTVIVPAAKSAYE